MSSKDFASKVNINSLVVSNQKQFIDVRDNVMGFSIFEDINSPFVYVELAFLDYEAFAAKFPLLGEEYLTVSFNTENSKPIEYTFLLYKNDSNAILNLNNAQAFVLRGVTLEKAFDRTQTVSELYSGTCTEIAEAVFNTYITKNTYDKSFFGEPSRGITKLVFPQLSPLESILMCAKKSVSNSGVFSPFLFFQNKDGFFFTSFNTLFKQSIDQADPNIHIYSSLNHNPTEGDIIIKNGTPYKADVLSFGMESNYDVVSKIDSGAMNNEAFCFDLTTKQYVLRRMYNLSENYKKFQLGASGDFHTEQFIASFDNLKIKTLNTITDVGLQKEGTQFDYFPDAIGESESYLHQITESTAKILMHGNSNITAGQALKFFTFVANIDSRKKKVDPTKTGNFLLTSVRHDVLLAGTSTYKISMSAIKGNNDASVEEMISEQ